MRIPVLVLVCVFTTFDLKEKLELPEFLHAFLEKQGSPCVSAVIDSLNFCRKNPELFQDLSFLW